MGPAKRHKKYWCVDSCATTVLAITVWLSLINVTYNEVLRCTVTEDCPREGYCFKDECARCLCPEGFRVINLYDGKLSKICQKREEVPLRIGDACERRRGGRECPPGSYCDPLTAVCVCEDGLRPHEDNKHCRRGLFSERCTVTMNCEESLGLRCKGKPNMCKCKASHHRPSKWTKYVLRRWDYSRVSGEPQECVARAVGEPCSIDRECAGVAGSGAICGPCGFCECRVPEHVTDVLGTKCGPGLGFGQTCSLRSEFVCDGTRGLQCGDQCDLYDYDFRPKTCFCSQMHDRIGDQCITKTEGSPCLTDLDCYPVRNGYGYCNSGRCEGDLHASGADYRPDLADRKCKKKRPISNHPGGNKRFYQNSNRTHRHKEFTSRDSYSKDAKRPLKVSFDNLTEIFGYETTTRSKEFRVDGIDSVKSDHRTSGGASIWRMTVPPYGIYCLLIWHFLEWLVAR